MFPSEKVTWQKMARILYNIIVLVILIMFDVIDEVTSQSPCLDSCRAIDKVYESACTNYPRETNEICHGTRTASINNCGIQCAALEGTVVNPARARCRVNCNTIVNQIFVTFCERYPADQKFTCLDQMKTYSETCFAQCERL